MDGKDNLENILIVIDLNIVLIDVQKVFETFHGVLFPFPVVQWRFRGFELTV
jgi:uncharacterized membrane protein